MSSAASASAASLPPERLADINPGPGDSDPGEITAFGDHLYFGATDGTGPELWRTDGTTTERVADINGAGAELWRTDGTSTEPLADINPGAGASNPSFVTVFESALYLSAMGKAGPRKRKFEIRRKQVELGADQPLALKLRLRRRGLRKARSALETRGGRAKAKLKVVATGPGVDVVGEQLRVRLR